NFFTISLRIDQSVDNFGISRQPVSSNFYFKHLRIHRGFPQQINYGVKRMVRKMQHYVPLYNGVGNTVYIFKCRVNDRIFAQTFLRENRLRKIHEMPEIVYSSTRYNGI